jgi:shikimate kinase
MTSDAGPIALIGLMATGKSTVGRLVAEASGRTFVDTDDEILARTGRTVRELWEDGGEAAFRSLESEVTVTALQHDDVVLAVPGGAVLDPAVQEALRRPDVLVAWLDAPPAVLATRVRVDDHRPLLDDDPEQVLARQLAARGALLEALATVRLDATRPPEEVAMLVLGADRSRPPR